MQLKALKYTRLVSVFLLFLTIANSGFSQSSVKQEKMAQLSFMVGDWVGTSKTIKNDSVVSEVPALQKIKYDLNKHIIIIDLRSETLQLHTIIYFDEKKRKYMYHPFSEGGTGQLPAELIDGQLIVYASKDRRYIFSAKDKNGFQEYGERLVDGKWERYFEDNFTNSQ
ncbi:MAG: hypothetical protein AB8B72_07560 [Crocinitomicaceae bacterium]